jgi:hypothetical protein
MRISGFTTLSRGAFSIETIEAKERELLSLLQWHVNPPTCAQFVYYFSKQFPDWDAPDRPEIVNEIFENAKYLTELSVFRSKFAFEYKSSTVAYGAVLCALQLARRELNVPLNVQGEFLRNMNKLSPDLTPCSQDVKDIQVELKKIVPDMFPPNNNGNIKRKLTRTVSFLNAETANPVAAAPPRVCSPTCESGRASSAIEPQAKRRKICS